MKREEYVRTQTALMAVAQTVLGLPLRDFLEWIGRSEALGPILDPTLYRAGCDKLTTIRTIAEGAFAFQHGLRNIRGIGDFGIQSQEDETMKTDVQQAEAAPPDRVLECLTCGTLRSLGCAQCPGCTRPEFIPASIIVDAPFSLGCFKCDLALDPADGPDTRAEAEQQGWTEIRFTPDSPSTCYTGLCPACRKEGQ